MRRLLCCIAVLNLFVIPAAHANTTYTIHDVFGSDSATGTITTDSNTGVLGAGDIVSFNVTINEGAASDNITSANGGVLIDGSSLTATASGLFFNFGDTTADFFLLQKPHPGAAGENFLCYQGSPNECNFNAPSSTELFAMGDPNDVQFRALSGVHEIASVSPAVPEPSSFVLLGSSLLGFAGAARRKLLKA